MVRVEATSGCSASQRRANGHQGTTREMFGGGSLDGRADEAAADAATGERVGDFGVHEDQSTRLELVDELGERAVYFDDEAVFLGIVSHLGCGRVHVRTSRAARSQWASSAAAL
jgi:hypothetical protein